MNLSYNLGMVSNVKQFKIGEVKKNKLIFLKRRRRRKGRVNCNPGNARKEGNSPRVVGSKPRRGKKVLQIESKWWLSRLDRIRTN